MRILLILQGNLTKQDEQFLALLDSKYEKKPNHIQIFAYFIGDASEYLCSSHRSKIYEKGLNRIAFSYCPTSFIQRDKKFPATEDLQNIIQPEGMFQVSQKIKGFDLVMNLPLANTPQAFIYLIGFDNPMNIADCIDFATVCSTLNLPTYLVLKESVAHYWPSLENKDEYQSLARALRIYFEITKLPWLAIEKTTSFPKENSVFSMFPSSDFMQTSLHMLDNSAFIMRVGLK